MLVVGGKEQENGTVAVRTRLGGDQGAMEIDAFIEAIRQEIDEKRLPEA